MMNTKLSMLVAGLALAGLQPSAQADTGQQLLNSVQENFSGATTTQQWYWFTGACLTAGTAVSTANPGTGASCAKKPFYSGTQLGGNSGNLQNQADSYDQTNPFFPGALRLTNDGYDQSGAIISSFAFPLSTYGLSVTFTTETYEGDSGGGNKDGADGISFFLQDTSIGAAVGQTAPTLGDWGGSLGYTCSNTNNSSTQGYDGMVGGYLAVGIDEFGNFWNPGDNTSSGTGYLPNRVALRGGGATAFSFLSNLTSTAITNAQLANPDFPYTIATAPYYPTTGNAAWISTGRAAAVQKTCSTGYIWDYSKVAAGNASSPTQVLDANGKPISLRNYNAISGAFRILPQNIAIENANLRGYGTAVTPNYKSNIYGIPITYNLTITTAGLLSLSYSYNGGAYQPVISQQQIANSNYPIPQSVRFGFGGSTGGSKNIHEIMCFQAIPQNSSQTSAGLNQKQTAKVQTGTQVYFAFYNANNWTGSLTSQYLDTPTGDPNANDLQIDPAVNWDASCVLTGVPTGQTCAKTGAAGLIKPQPATRTLITWVPNSSGTGGAGAPFEWASLSSTQQQLLDAEDTAYGSGITTWRLNYLRGSRADEQNASGVDPNNNNPPIPGGLRARTSVLGDIIDSSPTWVGPPSSGYPNTWADLIAADVPGDAMIENLTTNTYGNFASPGTAAKNNEQQRLNVVYTGANDGFMHGFETGSFKSDGTYNKTNNDGLEVIGYMPAYVVNSIDDAFTTTTTTTSTGTTSTYAVNPASDFSDPQYGHKFSVDAPPGTGDLFYNNAWHTWLVGGMGPGGKAIYALDITDPSQFSESNASGIVIGEWSNQTRSLPTTQTTTTTTGTGSSAVTTTTTTITGLSTTTPNTLTCVTDTGTSTCSSNLGNTYGVPQIRRFHNGSWGAVFGNGLSSTTGDAGIFVLLVTPNSGTIPAVTFRYLSTGWAAGGGNSNGIAYTTPADLDGDHITDYVYAGDLQGNVWRFDLTSSNPANWAVTPNPIFTTAGGPYQPITTKLAVASIAASPFPRVLIEFGTGQQTAFTNNQAAKYAPFTTANVPATNQAQALYGIWDSRMGAWNGLSSTKYAAEESPPTLSGTQYLQQQTILNGYATTNPASACGETSSAGNSSNSTSCVEYFRTVSSLPVCWADTTPTACNNPQYGWYLNLDTGYANPTDANDLSGNFLYNPVVSEQVIFNPTLEDGAFIVNTTIPPTNSLRACASTPAGGWTMAINPATGGAFTSSFFGDANHNFVNIGNQIVSGIALNGTGSASVVLNGTATYLVTQTVNGQGAITAINPPGGTQGSRLTWIQKR